LLGCIGGLVEAGNNGDIVARLAGFRFGKIDIPRRPIE